MPPFLAGTAVNPAASPIGGFLTGATAGMQPLSAGTTETTSEAQKGAPGAQTNNILQQIMAMLNGQQNQQQPFDLGALGQLLNPRALDPVAQANAGSRDMYGFGSQAAWDSWGPKPPTPAPVPAPVMPPTAPNPMAQAGLLGGILGGYR